MTESYIQSSLAEKDPPFDAPLRPKKLSDFSGQEPLKQRLNVFLQAAKQRQEPLGHALFHGPPGLGKTTLASILAHEMGTNLVTTSGPTIEKAADLAGLLTNLEEGDVLFIDEIHRLNKAIEEYLYPAMEDFSLDLLIDSGPSSRSVQVKLKRFTLVGATTRSGLLSSPMRSRFAFSCRLEYYDPETLATILTRSAKLLKVAILPEAALEIATRSRGTPRIANHLLRWVRDFAQIHHKNPIDLDATLQALQMLAIDHIGLDEMDKKLLETIIDHHNGGPVGLNTLAVALSEDASTLSEVYEPYLVMQGLLRHTPRGREATDKAYKHLEKELP
ncbi:MAG: Holliday junction branch migration DNA helicase RuvB [Simkaniaceae bacterium]|nr:Holliday junction branch migration DNA helicase RuvB [Candidatus Sacchlamyda saccharinae]